MKKSVKLAMVIGLVSISTGIMAQTTTQVVTKQETTTEYQYQATNPFACMGRGLMNIAMCWIEIPRCMFYDNSEVPVAGLIYGTVEGAGFTTYRAVAGLYDFISLGYSDEGLYFKDFPEFFWDSTWVPPEGRAVQLKEKRQQRAAAPVATAAVKPAAPAVTAKPVTKPVASPTVKVKVPATKK